MQLTFVDDEGEERTVTLRTHKEVCHRCHGEGKHVNPNVDGNGLPEELASDMDFMEDYLGGMYDVTCEVCQGQRVVDLPDPADPNYCIYEVEMELKRQYEEEIAAERRAGC